MVCPASTALTASQNWLQLGWRAGQISVPISAPSLAGVSWEHRRVQKQQDVVRVGAIQRHGIIKFQNQRRLDSQHHTVTERWRHRSTTSQNCGITESYRHGTVESQNHRTTEHPALEGTHKHHSARPTEMPACLGCVLEELQAAAHAFAALLPSGCISTSSVSPAVHSNAGSSSGGGSMCFRVTTCQAGGCHPGAEV